jgi:hypothetical protein
MIGLDKVRRAYSAATQPFVIFSTRFPPLRLFNAIRKRVMLNARFRSAPPRAAAPHGVGERDFVFLADIFANDQYLDTYLDAAHYGDTATRKPARAIARRITENRQL